MRLTAVLMVALLLVCAPVFARSTFRTTDGAVDLEADTISGLGAPKTVLSGSAHVKLVDKAAGTVFEADAATITIVQFVKPKTDGDKQAAKPKAADDIGMGLSNIKSVDFVGPVKITYIRPKEMVDESGAKSKVMNQMDANSDSANYDGAKQMAYLRGNVTMTVTDPTLYQSPAVATCALVELNMKPNPGPDDFVWRISTPNGVSRLEATPLPKEETKSK